MLKIVFVDDEAITLRLLAGVIHWEKYGIEVAGTARDGVEGLALVEQVQPDIIIADIQMPNMNGLAFAEELRKRNGQIKILLLTAYAKFEYAQKAIQYRVSDYLLKPLDEEKLESIIENLVAEIQEEKKRKEKTEQLRNLRDEKMIQTVYEECYDAKGRILSKELFQNGRRTEVSYRDYYCVLEQYPHTTWTAKRVETYMLHVVGECMEGRYALLNLHPGELIILCEQEAVTPDKLYQALTNAGYCIGIGVVKASGNVSPKNISAVEETAEYALWMQRDILQRRDIGFLADNWKYTTNSCQKAIDQLVKEALGEAFLNILRDMVEDVVNRYIYPGILYSEIESIFMNLVFQLEEKYPTINFNYVKEGGKNDRLRLCGGNQEIVTYFEELINAIQKDVRDESGDSIDAVIEMVKIYTMGKYGNLDFSLQEAADYVGLSRNYFSKVFHDVTGMKFWAYVTDLRMNKARQLLKETNYSVREIALAVGYKTEDHFGKRFKEIEGITPISYRRREKNR